MTRTEERLKLALRAAVILASLGLASIPVIVLVQTLFGTSIPSAAQLTQVPNVAPGDPVPGARGTVFSSSGCKGQQTIVGVELVEVDVEADSATAEIWACLGPDLVNSTGAPSPIAPTLTVAGRDANLTTSLTQLARAENRSIQLGDSDLPPGQNPMVLVGAVTLGLQGYPRRYPLDTYVASVNASDSGPCSAITHIEIAAVTDPDVDSFDWSLVDPDLTLAANGRLEYSYVGPGSFAARSRSGKILGGCSDAVTDLLHASRPASTKLFVLSLIGIPLLLIALLAVRLSEGAQRSTDGLVGVIAIMLAILPIRAVLVPGEITSLTLVDFVLASEMALLAFGTVVWFVGLRPRRAAVDPA